MRIHLLIAVMTLQWLPLNAVAQVACGLPLKGTQSSQCTEDEEKAGKKSCPRTLVYDKQAIVFATGFRVNTDGNLRSYSAGDPRGTRCADLPETADPLANGCAMNTVCNGASVLLVKGGTTIVLPGHKEGDKTACSTMVKQFERIRDAKPKWLPKDGSRVSFGGVIATKGDKGDNRHVPCETDGFLVSMASTRSGVKPKDRCDQAQWLDAAVPSIVVPQCWSAKYREKIRIPARSICMPRTSPTCAPVTSWWRAGESHRASRSLCWSATPGRTQRSGRHPSGFTCSVLGST